MAWSEHPSTRRERLPRDWHRDHESGPMCGLPANQVDHIERGDDHRMTNLQALCRAHHATKSASEGGSARASKYDRRRPPEAHPGMVPPPAA